jgi:hypothetical protein
MVAPNATAFTPSVNADHLAAIRKNQGWLDGADDGRCLLARNFGGMDIFGGEFQARARA